MAGAAGIESEIKWRLEAAGHARIEAALRRELGPPQRLIQRNRFYDSADARLRRRGTSLRLRLENQRLLMTCKRQLSTTGGYHRNHEDERWLSTALWPACTATGAAVEALLPLPEAIREALGAAPLRCLGGFDNLRLGWRRGAEAVALDRTDYAGRWDHELEVETDDAPASRSWWEGLMTRCGVAFRDQPLSKLHRLVDLLESRH